MEEEILKFWRKELIFQKSIDQRPEDKAFSFYDGPPFATGLPHYGHLLAGTIKDVIPRYKTMRGFRVERRFGWDTHGLPVEYEVEQALKLNGRHEIETFGEGNFNEECRAIVLRYTREWQETVERMARWVDFDNDYKTMDIDFMESVWWVFKQLWDKRLIYEGVKVVPYSWRVSTPLSNFEANLNYKDIQDPSVTLQFKVKGEENLYLLAWTTTPWTLPSNMGLCAGPKLIYCKIRDKKSGDAYILTKSRIDTYFDEGSYEVQAEMQGTELQGMTYEPLFDFAKSHVDTTNTWALQLDDYVNDDSGTGIVHLACFGEDDVRIFQRENIPIFDPVDDEGNFMDYMEFIAGKNMKDADKLIIQRLKEERKMFRHETVQHSYPFCWRTDTPLIYKPISTWFVNVEEIKKRMVAHNRTVHWVPGHIRDGRFGKWLENARDWAISRNRFWGNHSATQYPDLFNCKTSDKSVAEVIDDQNWLENTFIPSVQQRGAAIIEARGASSAASAANAAIDHVRDWIDATSANDWVSMAVCSDGSYGVEEGLISSFPVTCSNGDWEIVTDLKIDDFSKMKIDASVQELSEERDTVSDLKLI